MAPGATKKQIKSAYRKLAFKYHPDRNTSASAARKFQEITEAHDFLLKHPDRETDRASSYEDMLVDELRRQERARMQQRARAQREKKKQQEDYFKRPEWHDPLLLLKYAGNGILLLFALAAILVPLGIAIFNDPGKPGGHLHFYVHGGGTPGLYLPEEKDLVSPGKTEYIAGRIFPGFSGWCRESQAKTNAAIVAVPWPMASHTKSSC